MYVEFLRDWDMSRRWESNWMQFEVEDLHFGKERIVQASCLEFAWQEVVGSPGGKIIIFVSNNLRSSKRLKEFDIDTPSNIENAYFLNIYFPSFLYFKIIYEPNGINSGKLTVGGLYR
ncbi:MAG: hypothetical protein N2560_10165 [Ignavibacteria bacterium]|nr:hypothetical protein [Ignavibacteria bacterium]